MSKKPKKSNSENSDVSNNLINSCKFNNETECEKLISPVCFNESIQESFQDDEPKNLISPFYFSESIRESFQDDEPKNLISPFYFSEDIRESFQNDESKNLISPFYFSEDIRESFQNDESKNLISPFYFSEDIRESFQNDESKNLISPFYFSESIREIFQGNEPKEQIDSSSAYDAEGDNNKKQLFVSIKDQSIATTPEYIEAKNNIDETSNICEKVASEVNSAEGTETNGEKLKIKNIIKTKVDAISPLRFFDKDNPPVDIVIAIDQEKRRREEHLRNASEKYLFVNGDTYLVSDTKMDFIVNADIKIKKKSCFMTIDEEGTSVDKVKYSVEIKTGIMETIHLLVDEDNIKKRDYYEKNTLYKIKFSKSRGVFETYISYLCDNTDYFTEYVFERNGWYNLGGIMYGVEKWYYLSPQGAVGDRSVPFRSGNMGKSFGIPSDSKYSIRICFEDYIQMPDITKDKSITTPIFFLPIISVMYSLFKKAAAQANFTLALVGPSNSKKTSVILAMTQIYDLDRINPNLSFESTEVGIEQAMIMAKDSPILIDDLRMYTISGTRKKKELIFENIVRLVGDRATRKRSLTYMDENPIHKMSLECMPIVTAEAMTGESSTLKRILKISIGKNDCICENLKYYQDNGYIIRVVITDFIKYLTENFVNVVSHIENNFSEYRDRQSDPYSVPRNKSVYATYRCAIDIFLEYATCRGYINTNRKTELEHGYLEAISRAIQINDIEVSDQDIEVLIFESLAKMLDERKDSIIDLDETVQYKNYAKDAIYSDEKFYYIQADSLWQHFENKYRQSLQEHVIGSKRQLIDILASMGIIHCCEESNGRKRKSHKLTRYTHSQERYIFIIRSKIDKSSTDK